MPNYSSVGYLLFAVVLYLFPQPAVALDGILLHNGRYVVVGDGGELSEELRKKIIAAEQELYIVKTRNGQKEYHHTGKPLIVSKAVRAEILKQLKINEDDSVFIKSIGEEKTKVFKVSSLEVEGEVSSIGDGDSVVGIGLVVDAKKGVASVGKTNPFNETKVMKRLTQENRTFSLDSKTKLIIDGHSVVQGNNDSSMQPYIFKVQAGTNEPVQVFEEYFGFYDGVDFQVYAGEILNDDTAFFYLTGFGLCGFFITFKNNKAQQVTPKCDQVGC